MIFTPWAMVSVSELVTRGQIVALLTGAIVPVVGFALGSWHRRHERVMFSFAVYMLGLLLVFWVQGVWNLGETNPAASGWRRALSDLIQLPYAWLYLRFVRKYFTVENWAERWTLWFDWLERMYLVPLVLVIANGLWGWTVSSWVILVLNLVNLLSSYVLAVKAWHRKVEGAGWFLISVVPLALSGLLLAVQWMVEPGGDTINGMLPFWLGVILHLFLFLIAMGRRERRIEQRS